MRLVSSFTTTHLFLFLVLFHLEISWSRATRFHNNLLSTASPNYLYTKKVLSILRGGDLPLDEYDDDDSYDLEEEEYEEYTYDDSSFSPRRPPPSSSSRRGPPPRRPRQPPPPTLVDQTTKLAKQSLDLATSATMTSLKSSGKAAYYLASPKHVSKAEICGVWRFDQVLYSMGGPEEDTTACAANIELTMRGDAIVSFEGETQESIYHFQERKWPRSCTIELEARAFQGPEDREPIRYWYKGYFRRKLADRSVIKIVGTIYECERSRFGKGLKRGREVGSFVARKRIQRQKKEVVLEDDVYDDYDDYDAYDAYDGYDEEMN